MDARLYRVMSRLSLPALRAQLLARPLAPPLLVREHGGHSLPANLPYLPKQRKQLPGGGGRASARQFAQAVLQFVAEEARFSSSFLLLLAGVNWGGCWALSSDDPSLPSFAPPPT